LHGVKCGVNADGGLGDLHVEYAERSIEYGIIFLSSPVYEYTNLDYERIPVYYRVHRAEYVIHMWLHPRNT